MPYKPTGRPNGRPKKVQPAPILPPLEVKDTRQRKGFRRAGVDTIDGVWRPPHRKEGKRRPMLHPYVVKG